MSKELAETGAAMAKKPRKTIQDHLESDAFQRQVALSLPKHCTPERFVRVALTAVNRNPLLVQCTQESLFQCLLDLSAMGLEADGRRAHLIPFKQNKKTDAGWVTAMICTLIVDYKGLVELAMRSGMVANIHADKVCENDQFKYSRGELVAHEIDFRNPRGKAYAYYALIRFKDGTEKCEVMTKEDVDAIRARSKSKDNGPWVTDYDEMAKKTAFKRASKWIQLSPEIRDAIDQDNEGELEARRVELAKPVFPAIQAPSSFLPEPQIQVSDPDNPSEIDAHTSELPRETGPRRATPVEALRNLALSSGVRESAILDYAKAKRSWVASSLDEFNEKWAQAFINGWPEIVGELKGGE